MTRYVLTKEQIGDVPPFTVGTLEDISLERFEAVIKFNFCKVRISLEALGHLVSHIAPTLWKARLCYRDGREAQVRMGANPYTGDPPPEWFVPVPPKNFFTAPGDFLPMEVITFRCSHIPEASDTWIYEEAPR